MYGLVVPVIPFSITERVGTRQDEVQRWTAILLACYSGAIVIGAPVAGFYADKMSSRRLPLLVGLVALGGATVLLMLGKSIVILIMGRILQGLSAGVVWSAGLALLADTVGSRIGVAMGYVAISTNVGMLISPVVGGAVYGVAGYYAVFYVGCSIVIFDIILRLMLVEKKVARQWLQDKTSPEDEVSGVIQRDGGQQEKPQNVKTLATPETDSSPNPPAGKSDESQPSRNPRPRHQILSLILSKRTFAALFGIVTQAGIL